MDKKNIIKQIGYTYILVLIGLVITPFLPILLTRTISLQEYGVYSLFSALIQLAVVILELSLTQYLLTHIPDKKPEERHTIFISTLMITLIACVISFFIFLAIKNPFLSINKLTPYENIYWIAIGISFFSVIVRLFYAYNFSKKAIIFASTLDFLKNNLWIIFLGITFLIIRSLTVSSTFIIWLIAVGITATIAVIPFLKDLKKASHKKTRLIEMRKALAFSIPLIPAIIASWVVNVINRYIINHYQSTEHVALYSLPYSILGVVTTIGVLITTILYPYFIAEKKDKKNEEIIRNISLKYGLIIILPAITGFLVLRREIITLVSGPNYLPSIAIIPFLFLYPLFAFLAFFVYQTFLSQHKTRALGILYSIGAVVNIILTLFLVPRYSIIGAAIATTISYLFIWLIPLAIPHRKTRLDHHFLKLSKIVLSTIFMGVLLFIIAHIISLNTYQLKIIAIIIGAVVYIVSLFLTRVFNDKEWTIIKTVLFKNKIITIFKK
ncbi:MAG: oligosaccharide flippase family protein [Nanoarchaeota archaeon]